MTWPLVKPTAGYMTLSRLVSLSVLPSTSTSMLVRVGTRLEVTSGPLSSRAMDITGVDFICVPTRDFEKADQFYGEVLGLRRSKRWGKMPAGEFETGSLTVALMQSDAFGL